MFRSDAGWCHCREYLYAAQAKKENVEERAGKAEVCVHVWEGNQRQGALRQKWERGGRSVRRRRRRGRRCQGRQQGRKAEKRSSGAKWEEAEKKKKAGLESKGASIWKPGIWSAGAAREQPAGSGVLWRRSRRRVKEGKTRTVRALAQAWEIFAYFSKREDKWRQQQCRTQNGVSLLHSPNFCLSFAFSFPSCLTFVWLFTWQQNCQGKLFTASSWEAHKEGVCRWEDNNGRCATEFETKVAQQTSSHRCTDFTGWKLVSIHKSI